jgi:hypothetical protein
VSQNPRQGENDPPIDATRYVARKAAILAIVSRDRDSVTFASLPKWPRSPLDMIIAAVAEANHCVIVTENERHFAGLKVFNPLRAN